MSEQDEIYQKVERRRKLLEELRATKAEIVSDAAALLAKNAALVGEFGEPSPARVAGTMVHAARCIDEAGTRLRDALGEIFVAHADAALQGREPLPLLLYLIKEPNEVDARAIEALSFEPVFPRGRWRPCVLYSGDAAPEAVAEFVRRYGGDCYVRQRERRRNMRGTSA